MCSGAKPKHKLELASKFNRQYQEVLQMALEYS